MQQAQGDGAEGPGVEGARGPEFLQRGDCRGEPDNENVERGREREK